MPVTSRIQPPATQIFTSDPLEQIFARDMFAPGNKGGLAAMMLNAAGDTRNADQATYMAGLARSNEAASMLERLQEAFKYRTELAKLVGTLAPHGFLPSTLAGGSDVFNGNAEAGDAAARIIQNLILAKTNQANAAAAASGSGNEKASLDIGPGGIGYGRLDVKGPNSAARLEALKQEYIKRGLQLGPTMDPGEAARRNALARQPGASQ